MVAVLSRHRADRLAAGGAGCCAGPARCTDCQAQVDEVRAARRDALIHARARLRQRRAVL